jgi:hypothetical protein
VSELSLSLLGPARVTSNGEPLKFRTRKAEGLSLRQGDYERASTLLDESLSLHRGLGNTWGIAAVLGTMGWLSLRQGDLNLAQTRLLKSLTLRHEMGDIGGIAWCLEKTAVVTLTRRSPEPLGSRDEALRRATTLFGAAAALRKPLDSAIDLADLPEYERQLGELRAQLDEAGFAAAWNEGQGMRLEQGVAYARGE